MAPHTHVVAIAALVATTALAQAPRVPAGHLPLDEKTTRVLGLQVALDRAGFSPGEIDAALGANTQHALSAFSEARGIAVDLARPETLIGVGPEAGSPLVGYVIDDGDVAGPFVGTLPDDLMAQAKLPTLGYGDAMERLAEKFHVSPTLLARLNAGAVLEAGQTWQVPNVEPFVPPVTRGPRPAAQGAPVVVTVTQDRGLEVTDEAGRVMLFAPVTVGGENDPLPVGEWKVTGVFDAPVFNYNPALFWDANPGHARARLPAGPNNPVGVVWIGIDREHYGLHGTPEPGRVGHAQSHGCIRLTNWDIVRVANLVTSGTRVVLR